MTSDNFLIDRVHTYVNRPGSTESFEDVVERFWVFVDFLQVNNLTRHQLAAGRHEMNIDFEIRSGDLTPAGLEVVKAAHPKWLRGIDGGKSPHDVKVFERALAQAQDQGDQAG